MSDIVERLRTHGDCEIKDIGEWIDFASLYLAEAADEITRLRAQNAELLAALKPFAEEADCWPDYHDDEPLVESFPEYDGKITVGACRRARAAIAKAGESNEA